MESSGSRYSLEFVTQVQRVVELWVIGKGPLGQSLSSASLFSVDLPFRILTEDWSSIATLRGVELDLVDRINFSYSLAA